MNILKRHTRKIGAWLAPGLASLLMTVGAWGQSVWTQPETVIINDATVEGPAKATPYPSTLVTSNLVGTVTKVRVTMTKLTHGYVRDVDAMLVGPSPEGPKKLIFMSDAGGRYAVNGVTLGFDDAAGGQLPEFDPISSGTYKVSNFDDGSLDNFPNVGGKPGSVELVTDLAAFTGVPSADETPWTLYIMDDNVVDAGTMAGWTLEVWTTPVIDKFATNEVVTLEDTAGQNVVTLKSSSSSTSDLKVTATSDNQDLIKNDRITVSGTGNTRTITLNPNANMNDVTSGPATITVKVEDEDKLGSTTGTFVFKVTPVNDPPEILAVEPGSNKITTDQGVMVSRYCSKTNSDGVCTETKPLLIKVKDIDSDLTTELKLTASSSSPSVVAGTNVFYSEITASGVEGTATFSIAPNGAGFGTADLTLIVTDVAEADKPLTDTAPFQAVVNEVSYGVFANVNGIVVDDPTGTPYPAKVQVANVSGLIGAVTVTLGDIKLNAPQDNGFLLVGPTGASTVLMRGAGGTDAVDPVRLTFDALAVADGNPI